MSLRWSRYENVKAGFAAMVSSLCCDATPPLHQTP